MKPQGKSIAENKGDYNTLTNHAKKTFKENSKMSMKKKGSSSSIDPEDIDTRLLRVKRARTIKKDQDLKLKLFPTWI